MSVLIEPAAFQRDVYKRVHDPFEDEKPGEDEVNEQAVPAERSDASIGYLKTVAKYW